MDNSDNNKGADKRPDKNLKTRFNSNWIFAIIVLAFIAVNLLYTGKTVQKTTTSDIKEMIAKRDIEKIVVINKELAEIYLKKEALESDRYPKVPKPGKGFGMSVPKAHFTYNIGDISNFEPFLLEAQKNAGYSDKDLIYPEYQTRRNWIADALSWLLLPAILIAFWLFMMKRMSGGGAGGAGGIFNVGKSRAQIFDKDNNVKLNFSDVAGLEEAKTEVM